MIKVSLFKNKEAYSAVGEVDLLEWLSSFNMYSEVIKVLRKSNDESEKRRLKELLPAVTVSCICSNRKKDKIINYTNLICIDIDGKDNPSISNMEELKTTLGKFPYIMYCSLSASGKGVFCIIRYVDWHNHKEHFYALEEDFRQMGIVVDSSCSDIFRLRFYSYDPKPYINMNAEIYKKVLVKRTIQKVQREKVVMQAPNSRGQTILTQPMERLSVENELLRPSNLDSMRLVPPINKTKEVQCILNYVIANEIDITAIYNDWFVIGNIVKSIYKNNGLEMFHKVSRFYPNYSKDETDNLYAYIETANYHYTYERIREIAARYLSNIAEILNG